MLDELKDEIDLESFFKTMGAKKVRRSSRGYSMRCLHPNHNDSGPSFHYRLNNHKFYCYGCGWNGDIIDIVETIKGVKFKRAIRWLKDFCGFSSTTTTKQLQSIIEKREKQRQGGDDDYDDAAVANPAYFKTDFGGAGSDVRSYIEKRGWEETLLASLGVGYCERGYFRDRIVFPVYDGNGKRLTTFAARTVHVSVEPKYLYPLDSFLSQSMWPLHLPLDGTPVFVEGCPDALRLREYGYNAYACLGSQLGDVKLDMIRKFFKKHDKLIVIPDNDRGGEDMLSWFGKLIHEFDILVVKLKDIDGSSFTNSDGKSIKDVDELGYCLGRDPIDQILKNPIRYTEIYINDNFKFKKPPSLVTDLVNGEPVVVTSEVGITDRLMTSLYRVSRCGFSFWISMVF